MRAFGAGYPGLAVFVLACSTSLVAGIGDLRLVRDIAKGDRPVSQMRHLTLDGDHLYLAVGQQDGEEEVFVLDLETDVATRLSSIGSHFRGDLIYSSQREEPIFYPLDKGSVYFCAWSEETGSEWWKTDGTAVGTVPLEELGPGIDGWVYRDAVRALGNAIEFYGYDGTVRGWWRLESDEYLLIAEASEIGEGHTRDVYPADDGVYFLNEIGGGGDFLYYLPDGATSAVLIKGDRRSLRGHVWGNRLLIWEGGDSIWMTDGTPEERVDLLQLDEEHRPRLGDQLAIESHDSLVVGGDELWRIDGTAREISRFVWDWDDSHGHPRRLTPAFFRDGYVYFFASSRDPCELWRKALAGGVKEFVQTVGPGDPDTMSRPIQIGESWYFFVTDDEPAGNPSLRNDTLWVSDGTVAGTRILANVPKLYDDRQIRQIGTRIIAPVRKGSGVALYVYDVATQEAREWYLPTDAEQNEDGIYQILGVHDGYLLFTAHPNGALSNEFPALWVSDGSSLGTRPVHPRVTSVSGLFPTTDDAYVITDNTYYSAGAGEKCLWRIHPRSASAERCEPDWFSDENTWFDHNNIKVIGESLYFILRTDGEYYLYRFHWDEALRYRLELPESFMGGQLLLLIGENLVLKRRSGLFALNEESRTWELLLEDAADLFVTSFSRQNVEPGVEVRVVFLENNGMAVTDGTVAGTKILFDQMPGGRDIGWSEIVMGEDTVFFTAKEWTIPDSEYRLQLWAVSNDGGNPLKIMDLSPVADEPSPTDLAILGNRCFFRADDGIHGLELWVSEGTPEETYMVKDCLPGPDDSYWKSIPWFDGPPLPVSSLTVFNGRVYFNTFASASQDSSWIKDALLWLTDGTTEGTFPLASSQTAEPLLNIKLVSVFPDQLFAISTGDGSSGGRFWSIGEEIQLVSTWETNAGIHSDGTRPIGLRNGTYSMFYASEPQVVMDGGDVFYFPADDIEFGLELYAIDRLPSARGYFTDALRPQQGWIWHATYGWIYGEHFPWVWMDRSRTWYYCWGKGLPHAWLYNSQLNWIYSRVDLYPWACQIETSRWFYMDEP